MNHMGFRWGMPGEPSTSRRPAPLSADEKAAIAGDLEAIVRSWVDAINRRQTYIDNPIYKVMDPNFKTVPRPPFPPEPENFTVYLARLNKICELCPDYAVRILSLDTNVHNNRTAEVTQHFEIFGAHPGITYQCVAIIRFRERSGKWLCWTFDTVHGM